jgi:isopenicillin N synthase-like dioxygenase
VPTEIPLIDIGPLFAANAEARGATDRTIMTAAARSGFMLVGTPADGLDIGTAARSHLLQLFDLAPAELRPLWRRKFDPTHANVYRGWFPLQRGFPTAKEGIDIGADIAYGTSVVDPTDPLREATPLPTEQALPGWRAAAAAYYLGMERIATALMRSIARGLGIPGHYFDGLFERGLSTLRLIRYPVRDDLDGTAQSAPELWVTYAGARRYLTGAPHVDSGFLTLLAQDGVEGLQARQSDGDWIDVPAQDGTLAVNFGKVLERWCGGRIKATEHRVIGGGRERRSIPFFHEARVDAEIAPLPLAGAAQFEPFRYGDYLWATTTQFIEFKGMEGLRRAAHWPPGARPPA